MKVMAAIAYLKCLCFENVVRLVQRLNFIASVYAMLKILTAKQEKFPGEKHLDILLL